MPTELEDDDDDEDLEAILAEEPPPPPTEAAIQAALADPTFAGIVARATRRLEGLLTEKALDHARRTLAVVFLADPHAASLLAGAREAGVSAAQPTSGAGPVKRTSAKRRRRPRRSLASSCGSGCASPSRPCPGHQGRELLESCFKVADGRIPHEAGWLRFGATANVRVATRVGLNLRAA